VPKPPEKFRNLASNCLSRFSTQFDASPKIGSQTANSFKKKGLTLYFTISFASVYLSEGIKFALTLSIQKEEPVATGKKEEEPMCALWCLPFFMPRSSLLARTLAPPLVRHRPWSGAISTPPLQKGWERGHPRPPRGRLRRPAAATASSGQPIQPQQEQTPQEQEQQWHGGHCRMWKKAKATGG
jgi:hypothetical protein